MSSIIQQLKLWDQLIEQRIKFEELMHKCNSLPQDECWPKLKELDKDGKLTKYQALAEEKLLKLFEECVRFENTVEQLNPDLLDENKLDKSESHDDEPMQVDEEQSNGEEGYESNLSDEEHDEAIDESDDQEEYYESDEERPFDDDEAELNKEETNSDLNNSKLIEFELNLNSDLDETIRRTEAYLSSRYDRLNSVRNDILNYWFEKTRFTLRGGKLDKNSLDAFEQSTVKSIDHLLLNQLKLIKRTQLKRGNYTIIGKRQAADEGELINSELVEKKTKEIYDTEIFDDSDFYHQLLRELVNSIGATNLSTTSKVNPKWLKLMKERFKANKYVDTKATKARKIRYKVHNELVNFMTPMTHLNAYDDEQHSNLIKSVFGKTTDVADTNLEFDDSDSD